MTGGAAARTCRRQCIVCECLHHAPRQPEVARALLHQAEPALQHLNHVLQGPRPKGQGRAGWRGVEECWTGVESVGERAVHVRGGSRFEWGVEKRGASPRSLKQAWLGARHPQKYLVQFMYDAVPPGPRAAQLPVQRGRTHT